MPTTSPVKEFNRIRAAFMRRVAAPRIPSLALKLAYLIAYQECDNESQTTVRKQETLARLLNVTDRTVRTLIDILQPLGLVVVPGHGPDRASTYWIDPDKAQATTYKRKPASVRSLSSGSQLPVLRGSNRKSHALQPEIWCIPTGSQLPPLLRRVSKKDLQGEKRAPPPPPSLLHQVHRLARSGSMTFGRSIRVKSTRTMRKRHSRRRSALAPTLTRSSRGRRSMRSNAPPRSITGTIRSGRFTRRRG
jgi:hypothetical protein